MQLKAVLTAKSHGKTKMKTKTTTRVTQTGCEERKASVAVASLVVRVVVVPRAQEKAKKDKKAKYLREKEKLTQFKPSGHSLKNN